MYQVLLFKFRRHLCKGAIFIARLKLLPEHHSLSKEKTARTIHTHWLANLPNDVDRIHELEVMFSKSLKKSYTLQDAKKALHGMYQNRIVNVT